MWGDLLELLACGLLVGCQWRSLTWLYRHCPSLTCPYLWDPENPDDLDLHWNFAHPSVVTIRKKEDA